MAVVSLTRLGRPRFVAQLGDTDLAQSYYDDFYNACATLRYRDIMALSRALNVHTRTIESWKYNEKRPDFSIMLEVIDWTKQGKPMFTEQPGQKKVSLL